MRCLLKIDRLCRDVGRREGCRCAARRVENGHGQEYAAMGLFLNGRRALRPSTTDSNFTLMEPNYHLVAAYLLLPRIDGEHQEQTRANSSMLPSGYRLQIDRRQQQACRFLPLNMLSSRSPDRGCELQTNCFRVRTTAVETRGSGNGKEPDMQMICTRRQVIQTPTNCMLSLLPCLLYAACWTVRHHTICFGSRACRGESSPRLVLSRGKMAAADGED